MFVEDVFLLFTTICYLNLPHCNFFYWTILLIFEMPAVHQRITPPFEKWLISTMDVVPFEEKFLFVMTH